jgi:hypothetical protein
MSVQGSRAQAENPNSDTVRLEGKHARKRYRARRLRALTSDVENTHALQ